jgi:LysR family transcriptional regulator (chromosome initiation inhibitor)
VQGCSVRPLGGLRYLPSANPAFASRWLTGPLTTVLPAAPVVVYDRRDDLQDAFARSVTGHGASRVRHHVPSSEAFVEAVAAGLGWGMVPWEQAEPRQRAGTLMTFAPDHVVDVPLYWQQWKLDSPALSSVAAAVAGAAAESLRVP